MTTNQTKCFEVDDIYGVRPGEVIPVIASFDTEAEASLFIETLPDYQTGRYGITDMDSPEAVDS